MTLTINQHQSEPELSALSLKDPKSSSPSHPDNVHSPVGIDSYGETLNFIVSVSDQACHGGIYSGEVNAKGKKHGPLKGSVYEGEWNDNIQNGQGVMKYANGNHFSGGFKNDREFGSGVMKYANGDVFTGIWSDSGDAEGIMRRANGAQEKGMFKVMWYGAGAWSYAPM